MELPKPDCTGSGQNAVHRSGSSAKRRHLDRLAQADQVPVAVHVVEAGDGWPHRVAPQRRQRERRLGARVRALPVVVEYNLHRAAGSNIRRHSLAQTGEEGRRRESERARGGGRPDLPWAPPCPGPHPALGPTLPGPTCTVCGAFLRQLSSLCISPASTSRISCRIAIIASQKRSSSYLCLCACVRACARACVRACAACVRTWTRTRSARP